MKWLVDTNVISETVRLRPNPNVLRWLDGQRAQDAAISVVTLAELQHGVLLTEDKENRAELAGWIDKDVLQLFGRRVLPVTIDILIHWLELQRLLSARRLARASADLLLAATAAVHNLGVATRSTRDFANTGITVYNPWTNKTQQMEAP